MPYQFDFDHTNQIARCRFEGQITDEDVRNYYTDAAKLCCTDEAARGAPRFFSSEFIRGHARDHSALGDLNTRACEPEPPASVGGARAIHFWNAADVRNAGRQDAPQPARRQDRTRRLGDFGSAGTAVRTLSRVDTIAAASTTTRAPTILERQSTSAFPQAVATWLMQNINHCLRRVARMFDRSW